MVPNNDRKIVRKRHCADPSVFDVAGNIVQRCARKNEEHRGFVLSVTTEKEAFCSFATTGLINATGITRTSLPVEVVAPEAS